MRLDLVDRLREEYPVGRLCRVLGVSRSGHYARCRRGEPQRQREDRRLKREILSTHGEARGRYGTPRVEQELRKQGIQTSRKRVARLRRELGLKVKGRRGFRVTTDSVHSYAIAPNRLKRRFVAQRPDEVWVGDVTYLRRGRSWLYLAFLLDVFSRRIVGWSLQDRIDEPLTLETLDQAIQARRPPAGLIHHTDRGATYCGIAYQQALAKAGIEPSMSRSGDCLDNAMAESWVKTLKAELGCEFASRSSAWSALFAYIEGFYNTRRLHSALGYRSPAEVERAAAPCAGASEKAVAPAASAAPATAAPTLLEERGALD